MSCNRLILIDDDDIYRELLKRHLRRAEMDEPASFSDAESFLHFLRQNQDRTEFSPLMIILDLNLPLMSGIDLLKEIRSIPPRATLDLSIIVNTSSPNPDDRNQCLKLGCLDYHVKSSDNHELIEAIKKHSDKDVLSCCI